MGVLHDVPLTHVLYFAKMMRSHAWLSQLSPGRSTAVAWPSCLAQPSPLPSCVAIWVGGTEISFILMMRVALAVVPSAMPMVLLNAWRSSGVLLG